MKKIVVTTTLAILLAACSQANNQQVFGSTNTNNSVMTIAQAKSQADNSIIIIEGNIQRQIDKDEYIIADSTGEIKVEIEAHQWNGLSVTSNDKIRIRGKLDNETFERADIEAFSVEKIQ